MSTTFDHLRPGQADDVAAQIDREIDSARPGHSNGPAARPSAHADDAGGDSGGGHYVFASVPELDALIGRWGERHRELIDCASVIQRIGFVIPAPAGDVVSRRAADSLVASFGALRAHCEWMGDYAAGYVERLRASRDLMLEHEARNVTELRRAGA